MYSPQNGRIRHLVRAMELSRHKHLPEQILAEKLDVDRKLLNFILVVTTDPTHHFNN